MNKLLLYSSVVIISIFLNGVLVFAQTSTESTAELKTDATVDSVKEPIVEAEPQEEKTIPVNKITEEDIHQQREEILRKVLREYQYNSKGRKDPFKSALLGGDSLPGDGSDESGLEPLELFSLKQLIVRGIIWGVTRPKVMIEDSKGKIHIVEKNAKLGRNHGYIAVIRESEVVVVESYNSDAGVTYRTEILKLQKSK